MIRAVAKGIDNHRTRLHDQERPIALLTSLYANSKRNEKKSKSVDWLDFCFYRPRNDGSSAKSENGAAMMILAKKKLLPSWGLFCFKEVTANADDAYRPKTVAYIADDAMLLNPIREENGYRGLLIAQESASESIRVMKNPETGESVSLLIPHIHTKIMAEESVLLRLN